MVKLVAKHSTLKGIRADIVAHLVAEDEKYFRQQLKELGLLIPKIQPVLSAMPFKGKENEAFVLFPQGLRTKKLLLVGLGKVGNIGRERLRRAASTAAKTAKSMKAKTLAIMEPDPSLIEKLSAELGRDLWPSVGTALGEGATLAAYKFKKYITSDSERNTELSRLILASPDTKRTAQMESGLRFAQKVCQATYFARDLANAPANEIYPETLAAHAVRAGRTSGFRVTVYDRHRIKKLKMGGLLGVAQGSERPPRFIVMELNANKRNLPTVVLIGKGVTFDAGGISIKPASGMAEMKMDMSGAAAVIGTMQAASRLRLRVHLVGLVPATENLLGGRAMKPGDILTHHNGKTSEVDNTDAEGRLILADALSYASRYKPDLVIDLATLTGACVVALGHYATGMMGNDQEAMDQLRASGERTYERVWQLPMFDEYEKLVKSDIADVKNAGGRWAGAITAAMFLKKFIGKYKWVHLDIAGTASTEESLEYIPKGASGVGVRLLIDFLENWKKK
jgi:leucyl aminopeptidase